MESKASEPGSVSFLCPSCMKYKIVRDIHEKRMAARYKCPNCGFEGPN